MNVALTVKSLCIKKCERRSEAFFVVLAGSDDSVRGGSPLITHSHVMQDIMRGATITFDGLGLWVLPPAPFSDEGILAWHVALWESDSKALDLGETLLSAAESVTMGDPLVAAISCFSGAAAVNSLQALAKGIESVLAANRDEHLLTWAGSMFGHQLEVFGGSTIVKENDVARVEYQVLVTEGAEAIEVEAEVRS